MIPPEIGLKLVFLGPGPRPRLGPGT